MSVCAPATTSPTGAARLRVLAFEAAGLCLALPAETVERVLEPPAAQRVPGTPDWFLGVCVTGGRLLPVTHLGAWLCGRSRPAPAPDSNGVPVARLLELHATLGTAGLLVDRVDGLLDGRDATPDELADDDPAERLGPRHPQARAVVAGGVVRALIDPVALMASPAFVDLAVSA